MRTLTLKICLLTSMLFANSACSLADKQLFQPPQQKNVISKPNTTKNRCQFPTYPFPQDISIFAAGAYSGRKLDYQIDFSGHYATQMDVIVNDTKKPVVLMLGAYEPTIWDISWTENSNIIAVLLSGHYKQVVTGLKKETPVLISTHENKGKCGFFYVSPKRLSALNPVARKLFSRNVDKVYLAKKGEILIGEAVPANAKLLRSSLTKPVHYRQTELSGIPGLEQAVSKGILRKATIVDANTWVEEIMQNKPPMDIPPVAGQGIIKPRRPLLLNAYVVLKPFAYPEGLYGGNSAVFFIPKGVPLPNGNSGHSSIYDFNTLSCTGSLCIDH